MSKLRFLEYFFMGYGFLWLLFVLVSLVTGSLAEPGLVGVLIFPILSVVYALMRYSLEIRAQATPEEE